jgi:hypothetical protein
MRMLGLTRSFPCVLTSELSISAFADVTVPAVLSTNLPKGFAMVKSFVAVDGMTVYQ